MKTVTYFMAILAAAHAGGGDLSAEAVCAKAEARSAKVEAAPAPEMAVAVRIYNYAAVHAAPLAAAQAETGRIFTSAGISLAWIDCRVPGGDEGAPCTEPLLPGRDLMLRLVDRIPAQGERSVALGESLLDLEQRGGVLMTVDLFPVRAVAGRAAMSVATLLGRAIAHEIGHLLLGSAEHPRLGLMRALWSHDELRGRKPAHWGFSAREAAQMRQTRLRAVSHIASARQAASSAPTAP